MDGMNARQFVAITPLHAQPTGPYATPGECEAVLSDALRGVALGGYDELICAWLVRHLDVSTLRVLISLIERVRGVGTQEAVHRHEQHERERNTGRVYYGRHLY